MAEPNSSRPSPYQHASAVSVQINPPPQPQNYDSAQQLSQTQTSLLVPPNQAIPNQNPTGSNSNPNQTDHYISMTTAGPSPAVEQKHGYLLNSLAEQFFSHVLRQSISTPPVRTEQIIKLPSEPGPVLGSFNFKVEPIQLLHVNSSPISLPNQSGSPNRTEPGPVQPNPNPSNSKVPSPTPKAAPQQEEIVQPNPLPPAQNYFYSTKNKPSKVFNNAGNLANLLPTGTVLAFQALIPSLSNNGKCDQVNKYFIAAAIAVFTMVCLLSSFTDSVSVDEKVYYGMATPKGLYVFNYDNRAEEEAKIAEELKKLRVRFVDFVHALGSVVVFLVFAFSGLGVQSCYFPDSKETEYSVVTFLPLMAGVLSSFLFAIFPTKRRGIGYTNNMARKVA